MSGVHRKLVEARGHNAVADELDLAIQTMTYKRDEHRRKATKLVEEAAADAAEAAESPAQAAPAIGFHYDQTD